MKAQLSTLVVEDDEAMRCLLLDLLYSMGYPAHTAADGREGIQMFEQGEFAIVLCDLGMPEIDGWEVCRRVKALAPQTVVVVVTGWRVEPETLQARGVDLVLHKPFTLDEFSKTMDQASGP